MMMMHAKSVNTKSLSCKKTRSTYFLSYDGVITISVLNIKGVHCSPKIENLCYLI